MDQESEKALSFVNQLIEKTKQGNISWSRAFEDGQFKAVLLGGKLAFVVQVKGETRKFQMIDENQEEILVKIVTRDEAHCDTVQGGVVLSELFDAILTLQELARARALQVNEKLANAEKLLAAI
jgi:hypothetical protein